MLASAIRRIGGALGDAAWSELVNESSVVVRAPDTQYREEPDGDLYHGLQTGCVARDS
ncbi:hypothetical protein WCD74_09955 [Actinomycetospora sp. OC33-EN08]|uniref:Uncharacterized protein n=1 Tax=Actinomycetospora aurantiaca TaxID=3129233 RepID=A0ABU8MNU4_9PSEU